VFDTNGQYLRESRSDGTLGLGGFVSLSRPPINKARLPRANLSYFLKGNYLLVAVPQLAANLWHFNHVHYTLSVTVPMYTSKVLKL